VVEKPASVAPNIAELSRNDAKALLEKEELTLRLTLPEVRQHGVEPRPPQLSELSRTEARTRSFPHPLIATPRSPRAGIAKG
jgi:hypothetical protein